MAKEKRGAFKSKNPRSGNNGLMNIKKTEDRYGGSNSVDKPIETGWHTITKDIEDIEAYILDYYKDNKYDVVKLWIGSDSLRRSISRGKHEVRLLSVICFRKEGKGVHIIKRRESHTFNRFVATAEKLNMEVNKTYELAMWLQTLGHKFEVHLDLNPNPEHESFNVYKHIHGWFESMGIVTEYKPFCAAGMSAADYYL